MESVLRGGPNPPGDLGLCVALEYMQRPHAQFTWIQMSLKKTVTVIANSPTTDINTEGSCIGVCSVSPVGTFLQPIWRLPDFKRTKYVGRVTKLCVQRADRVSAHDAYSSRTAFLQELSCFFYLHFLHQYIGGYSYGLAFDTLPI